ncbi:hypothetical protein QDR37_00490 [Amnibacterium sp. CER49]|uniref:hypothetical protein n=1 Tax=Amnibacterium sp. CER49 TaxID=3039161 RepID=UPI00244BA33D|nr:hypothetical protein [Amnibacterium sp. CER49]MDH2442414.1 hypothetical protein [Amnibacterium sp. CER49]
MGRLAIAAPRTTTLLGGAGLAIGAALALLTVIAAPEWSALPLSEIVLLVSGCVLAFGLQREHGITGDTSLGRPALVLLLGGDLMLDLLARLLPDGQAAPAVMAGALVLVAAAGVVGAVDVARAGVLRGVARFALLPVAAVGALLAVPQSVPLDGMDVGPLMLSSGPVRLLLLLIAGVLIAVHGRVAGLVRAARLARRKW